jgi:hypothetical protein
MKLVAGVVTLLVLSVVLPVAQCQSKIDASFEKFWAADSPAAAARAALTIPLSVVLVSCLTS